MEKKLQVNLYFRTLITGCVEVLLMHPLDLMKTRFQLQGNAVPGDPGHYKGVTLQSSLNTNHRTSLKCRNREEYSHAI